MGSQIRMEPTILAAAERQAQFWARTAEIEDRTIRLQSRRRLAEGVQTYLAISREEGAGGSEIAQAAGKALGFDVLDRELLDRVAERYHLSRPMLKLVDETRSNWIHDVLGTWMDRNVVTSEKYLVHLAHVVLAAVREKKLVLVGRGAQFLLPREKGLAVRIVASLEYRTEQVMRREQLGKADARRLIEELDAGRREFVQRFFHRDIDDPHVYDLVINVERIAVQAAVKQIVLAMDRPWA